MLCTYKQVSKYPCHAIRADAGLFDYKKKKKKKVSNKVNLLLYSYLHGRGCVFRLKTTTPQPTWKVGGIHKLHHQYIQSSIPFTPDNHSSGVYSVDLDNEIAGEKNKFRA